MLGPVLITPLGIGLMAVQLAALAISGVDMAQASVASSILNVGQQIGASLGIAGLGTVVWPVVASHLGRHGRHRLAPTGIGPGHLLDHQALPRRAPTGTQII